MLPKRFLISAQALGAPGTVTGVQPLLGILPASSFFSSLILSIEASIGARPLELSPYSRAFFSDQISAKASEPIPFAVGSTTVSAAAAATAASIALPPFRRISRPAAAARGLEQFTMPFLA